MTAKKVIELPAIRRILVEAETKKFILEVGPDIRLTFGPWSPPTDKFRGERANTGTLRLYRGATTAQNILACYTGVVTFRDLDQVTYKAEHDLPLCNLCKSNLVVPGEDLCASCAGIKDENEVSPSYAVKYGLGMINLI